MNIFGRRSTNNAIKLSVHVQKSSFVSQVCRNEVDQFLITNDNSRKPKLESVSSAPFSYSNENIRTLCAGEKGFSFHRVNPGFMCQNSTGYKSIYGNECQDENLALKNTGPSILFMANSGHNTNGSQFFLCTTKMSHQDNKHGVFGNVVPDMEDVRRI